MFRTPPTKPAAKFFHTEEHIESDACPVCHKPILQEPTFKSFHGYGDRHAIHEHKCPDCGSLFHTMTELSSRQRSFYVIRATR